MKKLLLTFLSGSIFLLHADWTDKITINGYFNVEFEDQIAGEPNYRVDEYASFDSDMLDIVLNIQATDNLRVAVDFSWEHGSQSEVFKGNVGYEYAFAEYTFTDSLKVRAGKMFTPFGIYNEIHTAKPSIMIIKEPNSTNKMYFVSDDTYEQTMFYPRWGTGLALLGDSNIANIPFDYVIQVTNGDLSYGVDANEYDKDDNNKKAITARVRADLTNNLQVGASFYYDTMTRYEKQYKTKVVEDTKGNTVDYVEKIYTPISTMEVNTQGAQMIWHISDDFRLEAEYITGTLDVKDITSFRRSGFSILPSYYIMENVNLYFLYTQADPNHDKPSDGVTNYIPGVNIEIDNNVFVKVDLLNITSGKNNTIYGGEDYSELRAALSIGF